jgi:hypothetical protein
LRGLYETHHERGTPISRTHTRVTVRINDVYAGLLTLSNEEAKSLHALLAKGGGGTVTVSARFAHFAPTAAPPGEPGYQASDHQTAERQTPGDRPDT